MKRRIWCETGDPERTLDGPTLEALARREIELILAVFPASLRALPATLGRCARAGLRVSLWPMLDDAQGRWANARTMPAYLTFTWQVLDHTGGHPVEALFVDLEPPIDLLREALKSPLRALRRLPQPGFEEARDRLQEAAHRARREGVPFASAVLPLVWLGGSGWEEALGVPWRGVPWAAVHAMIYSSLVEGYSGGLAGPSTSGALVALTARQGRARLGGLAGLSLGVIGPGALGDERPLESTASLRRDLAAAIAAGVEDIALFDLVGAQRRGPLDRWLDALIDPLPGAAPAITAPARLAAAACQGVGVALKHWRAR
jgi:hypothetical protein